MNITTEPVRKKRRFADGDSTVYNTPGVKPIATPNGSNIAHDSSDAFITPNFSLDNDVARVRSTPTNINNVSGVVENLGVCSEIPMKTWNNGSHKKIIPGDILFVNKNERLNDGKFLTVCNLKTLENTIQNNHSTITGNIQKALNPLLTSKTSGFQNAMKTAKISNDKAKKILVFSESMFYYNKNDFETHTNKHTATIPSIPSIVKFYENITSILPSNVWKSWKKCGIVRQMGTWEGGKYETSVQICTWGLNYVRKMFNDPVESSEYLIAAIVYDGNKPTIKLSHGTTVDDALRKLPKGKLQYFDFIDNEIKIYKQIHMIGKNCIILGKFGNLPQKKPSLNYYMGDVDKYSINDKIDDNTKFIPNVQFILE